MTTAPSTSNYGSAAASAEPNEQLLLTAAPPSSQGVISRSVPTSVRRSVRPLVDPVAKLSKILIYVFILFACVAAGMAVIGALDLIGVEVFLLFLLFECAMAVCGALGIYKWGTIAHQIDRFKGENNQFESNVVYLRTQTQRLERDVQGLQHTIGGLKKNVEDLDEQLSHFDKLRADLQQIAGDNEHLLAMVDNVNGMFDDMRNTIVQNRRTEILTKYYDIQFMDQSAGMSQMEYEQFLAMLDRTLRARFESYGSFAKLAGADEVIDLREFQQLLNRVLVDMEEELIQGGM